MTLQMIMSTIGLSSIILSIINIAAMHFQKKKLLKFERRAETIEHRYQTILSTMLVVLDAEMYYHVQLSGERTKRLQHLSEEERAAFFLHEIEAYYIFSHLYASDNVLSEMKKFLDSPTKNSYRNVAKAMRKDLWLD